MKSSYRRYFDGKSITLLEFNRRKAEEIVELQINVSLDKIYYSLQVSSQIKKKNQNNFQATPVIFDSTLKLSPIASQILLVFLHCLEKNRTFTFFCYLNSLSSNNSVFISIIKWVL